MARKLKAIALLKNAFLDGVLLTVSTTGIICSLIAFAIVGNLEKKKIEQKFQQDSVNISISIERNIEKNLQILESIVSFYNASENVTRQEFQKFTHSYLANNREIKALKWIPRVADRERKAYKQAARQEGLARFEIREQNINQEIIRAKSRNEYFPVYFVEPYQENKVTVGFDFASNTNQLRTLQLARDTGKAITTAPVLSNFLQPTFLIFSPIYQHNTVTNSVIKRRQNLAGFAVGVFAIADIVEEAVPNLQAQDIDVTLVNQSALLKERIFYTSNSSLTPETIEVNGHLDIDYHYQLNVAQQQWLIVTQPTSAYILRRTTWYPWGILGGGILLTTLLSGYIRERLVIEKTLQTKTLRLEEENDQKTKKLNKIETKYRNIFDNVSEGIFICTLDGKYISANRALANIYGYDSPQKLISQIDNIEKQLFVNREDWRELTLGVELHQSVDNFECQAYHTNGSKIWISTSIHLFKKPKKQTIYYEGTVIDITVRKQVEYSLIRSNNLLRGISLAQSRFIKDVQSGILLDGLLENLLQITNSEYGFIGEVLHTRTGEPYLQETYMKIRGTPKLKSYAINNLAWNKETLKFCTENNPQGIEFNNLNTIFEAVIVTGQPVIINTSNIDFKQDGLATGNSPIKTFVGLPFYSRGRCLAIVGLVNRPNGYDQDLLDYLEPFLATCSNILEASRSEKQRQQAELALRESEERYRSIVETANEGIWLLDTNGQTIFVNSRVLQMLGYAQEEISNKSLFDFVEQNNHNQAEKLIQQIFNLSPGITESYDLQFCRRDGSKLWTIVSFSSIADRDSQCMSTLAMIMDISDRKQAEIELAEAKYMAEVASRTKSHFLANMSHELRTPLNGILGSVRLLQSNLKALSNGAHISTANCQKGLDTIERSGTHLLNLIEDILEFAQIETTPVQLYSASIHVPTFLAEMSAIVNSQAMTKGLTFTSEIPHDLPLGIEVDRQRLKQVLIELFNNAIKFTERGRVTFRIVVIDYCEFLPTPSSSEINLQDYTTLRFEAIDTGIGIDSEHLTKIFQPFEQLGDIHNKAAGTGLGLTIAQQLLYSMNSELKVTSSLGMGSTFWFDLTLPVVKNTTIENQTEIDVIVGYQGKKRRLLIADDQAENRLLLLNLLEPLGFEVFVVDNGQQEIELAQKVKPDLILTDLIMPIKTGFEAVEELRRIPYFNQIPIIALSSSVLETNSEQTQIAGCDALLAKPIDKQKLLALLQKYLHLSWIECRNPELIAVNANNGQPKHSDLITPPIEELETLYKLAMLGSMKKIRQWAIALEELDIQYQPFAEKLKQLSQNFQEKAIVNLVEKYLHQESN